MNEKEALILALQEKRNRLEHNKLFYNYFVPNTPFSIEHYAKHYEFFSAGATHRQRALIAGNRIGKTESAGLYEITCHAIGWYPEWWPGLKVEEGKSLVIWVAGDTKKTSKDILQKKLLGDLAKIGTGLIPSKYINRITRSSGIADAVDTIYIDRIGGGTTQIVFKSYDAGRDTFQGTEVDFILLDEEPPQAVATECFLRLMSTDGKLILTFTPLMGMTELISSFLEGKDPGKIAITATWDDVPHLTQAKKDEFLAGIPEYQRDARTAGIPQLGSGAIYRVLLDNILVEPFSIPDYWKKSYSLDVGWNVTACIFVAKNPDTDVSYIYDLLYLEKEQPHEYARKIKMRGGDWMLGVVDSASNNTNQHDGQKIFDLLTAEGLKLSFANKSVEAGLLKTWQYLNDGKLKVFNTLNEWKAEYRVYRRDEKGKIVKAKDHAMDVTRYWVMSGEDVAKSKMEVDKAKNKTFNGHKTTGNAWMG